MDFSGISNALYRAIGLPSRMSSGIEPTGWNFHVWVEVWIETLPEGSDHWYVFDATDGIEVADNRVDYGALVNPTEV
jgi:transglutaminase-like putative cysteine protease